MKIECIDTLTLIGAGGHSLVALDTILLFNPHINIVIRDDNHECVKPLLGKFPIHHPAMSADIQNAHITIGNNDTRRQIHGQLCEQQTHLPIIIHPSASVSPFATIHSGTFIASQAVVAPEATIGHSCIINHGAVIDHECYVDDWCHIAPNATLGGNVHIAQECLIGSGAIILPGVSIGRGVIIGAGAVVTKDVKSRQIMVGVPAKSL